VVGGQWLNNDFVISRVNIRLCGWLRKDTSTLVVGLVLILLHQHLLAISV